MDYKDETRRSIPTLEDTKLILNILNKKENPNSPLFQMKHLTI